MNVLDKKNTNAVFDLILLICTFVIVGINIWTLNKGLMPRDEGWFNYLVKDCPRGMLTTFYFFIPNLFGGNIIANRVVTLAIDLFTALLFGCSIYYYFLHKEKESRVRLLPVLTLSVISLSLFNILVCNVLGYTVMNRQTTLIATSLLLFAFSNDEKWGKLILIFLSGLVAGNVVFFMTTNILMPASVFVFLLCLKDYRKYALIYFIGCVAAVVVFFTVFYPDPISTYVDVISRAVDMTVNNKFVTQHGSKAMMMWCVNALKFFGLEVFPLMGIFYLTIYFKSNKPQIGTKVMLCLLFVLFLFFYVWQNVAQPQGKVETMAPFFALLMVCLVECIENKKTGLSFALICLVFSFVISLSIGSDTDISRKTNFFIFVLPLIYAAAKLASTQITLKAIFCMTALVVIYTAFFTTFPFRNNWAGIVYSRQTEKLESLGIHQNLLVEPRVYDETKELKEAGLQGKNVILSSMFSWSYCYILDCKPIDYNFNLYEDAALMSLKQKGITKDVVLVEENTDPPFTEEFKQAVLDVSGCSQITKVQTTWHNLYFLK